MIVAVSSTIPNLIQKILNANSLKNESSLENAISELALKILDPKTECSEDLFIFIPPEINARIFQIVLKDDSSDRVMKLINSKMRAYLLETKNECCSVFFEAILKIESDSSKITLNASGLSQANIQRALNYLTEKQKVKHLIIKETLKLKNLDFLEGFPNLVTLECPNSSLTGINGIEKCPSLKTIDLAGSQQLRSLNGLEKCINLKQLIAKKCTSLQDDDLSTNLKLPNLELLNFSDTSSVRTFPWLNGENLPSVKTLYLSEKVYLPKLADIAKLPKLEKCVVSKKYLKESPSKLPSRITLCYSEK